jgi:7-cyano-7-deazaguanine synthase
VPEGHYEQDNMKETVVPNRNKIFASLTQAVALSIANEKQEQTDIALGIHAGDFADLSRL